MNRSDSGTVIASARVATFYIHNSSFQYKIHHFKCTTHHFNKEFIILNTQLIISINNSSF